MALKDKLLENKKLNEQIKFAIAEEQSRLPFNLGESDTKVQAIDFADLFKSSIIFFLNLCIPAQAIMAALSPQNFKSG